jgi:hypothetical protein
MVQLVTAAVEQGIDPLRVPPHSVEAEQAVLGGLLLDNHAWDKIADFISVSDFYRADHRLLYQPRASNAVPSSTTPGGYPISRHSRRTRRPP